MALNDIIVPRETSTGGYAEIVLTPASIGAAAAATVTVLAEDLTTIYNTVSELEVNSIAGLPDALALKADLLNGTVPATQLPPISFQTTRHLGDGTAFSFAPPGTLTNSDSPSAISVTVNGVTQEPGSDYEINVATNRVVLGSALGLGDKIVITRPILLPSNSTLSAEQLGAASTTALSAESLTRANADSNLQAALALKASTSHNSTHATGGADALTPADIGAESLFVSSSQSLTGTAVTLGQSRAKTWVLTSFNATNVTLPTSAELGDRVVLRGGSPVLAPITIISTGVSDTINTTGQQISYSWLNIGSGPRWYKNPVDRHTHAIADTTGLQTALDGKASTSHKAAHATGGSDAIAPADIGAAYSNYEHQQIFITGQAPSANVQLLTARNICFEINRYQSPNIGGKPRVILPQQALPGDVVVIKKGTILSEVDIEIPNSGIHFTLDAFGSPSGSFVLPRVHRYVFNLRSTGPSGPIDGWVLDQMGQPLTYHVHAIADTTGLQSALDAKASASALAALAALEARVAALEAAQAP